MPETYTITAKYVRNGEPEKTVTFQSDELRAPSLLDRHVIEQVMKVEDPDAIVAMLVPAAQRGDRGAHFTNVQLATNNGITDLIYEIDGVPHRLTT